MVDFDTGVGRDDLKKIRLEHVGIQLVDVVSDEVIGGKCYSMLLHHKLEPVQTLKSTIKRKTSNKGQWQSNG